MGAISALSDTGGALLRNPVLFGGALVIAVVGTTANAVANFVPVVGLLVGLLYFFVEPLFAGGLLGMANDAVAGSTTFGAFWEHGKANYVDLLVARLVLGVVTFVAAIALAVALVLVVGLSATPPPGTGTDPAAAVDAVGGSVLAAAGLYLVALLVALVVGLVIQFYPAAIVVGDAGPLESFGYSYRLFRAHPLSVVGYSVVSAVVLVAVVAAFVGVASVTLGGVGALTAAGGTSEAAARGSLAAGLLVVAVAAFVLRALQLGALRTYYVAFVRSVAS